MATEQATHYRLDDEQRARVEDCLRKEGPSLPYDRLEQFICSIEASVSHFRATPPKSTFRDTHDALRELSTLAHEDDPPIGQLKARLAQLPLAAREYIGRRAPNVTRKIGIDLGGPPGELPERAFVRFVGWTNTAEAVRRPEPPPPLPKVLVAVAGTKPVRPPPLVMALRVLSSEGGRIVEGRSRGGGKRSGLRLEPEIMGEVRGAGTAGHLGGRPTNDHHKTFVMHLAKDWLIATGHPPKTGRSDITGFGDLVCSIFQWLNLPEGSAAYALRNYWAAVETFKAREPLEDFLRRYGVDP